MRMRGCWSGPIFIALVFSQFNLSPILAPKCLYIFCYFLYSCQRVTNGRNVICEVQVSQPLLTPLDSITGFIHRFSHDKVDGDEEEKGGENTTLPLSSLNVEHLCISDACFHTATENKVECLEYVGEFVWDPVVSIFSRVTHGGCCQKTKTKFN